MYSQPNFSGMEQEIVQFINNPSEDSTERIYECLQKLCTCKYQSQIAYNSSKYCALTGVELKDKDKAITINNYNFSIFQIQEYYLRQGILDLSIGDLKFTYFDGVAEKFVSFELTLEMLQTIYGENLNKYLEEAYKHFNNRLDQQVSFLCKQTGRQGVISEMMIVNGEQVCSEWAHHNKDQLSEEQRKQLESSQRIQYSVINSQNIH